jgi:hypothetical protein
MMFFNIILPLPTTFRVTTTMHIHPYISVSRVHAPEKQGQYLTNKHICNAGSELMAYQTLILFRVRKTLLHPFLNYCHRYFLRYV